MITSSIMATCIAFRIGGDICGRETEDNSDYCFIHRDLDWLRGVKDIADYMGGGMKFLGYAKTALGILVIFSQALAKHATIPLTQSTLADVDELRADAETLVSDLAAHEGTQHTEEEAQLMQARLSDIIDRIEAIRAQADEIVPSPSGRRLEPLELT